MRDSQGKGQKYVNVQNLGESKLIWRQSNMLKKK